MGIPRYAARKDGNEKAGWPTCHQCGEKYKTYNKNRKYCSNECYNESRKNVKTCAQCGERFSGKVSNRKYCSKDCFAESRRKEKRKCPYCEKPIKNFSKRVQTCGDTDCRRLHFLASGTSVEKQCIGCKGNFVSARSAKRKYCSYQCFIDNGGAFRAGKSSARAVKAYGAKKDANHKEIVAALEKCGIGVIDTSHMGGGFPDLICGRQGLNHFAEIKNPETAYGRKGLNKLQTLFADDWRGEGVFILETLEDVTLFANGMFDKLKQYPERKFNESMARPSTGSDERRGSD